MCLARAVPGQHLDGGPEVASRVAENKFMRTIGSNRFEYTYNDLACGPSWKNSESARSAGWSVENERPFNFR